MWKNAKYGTYTLHLFILMKNAHDALLTRTESEIVVQLMVIFSCIHTTPKETLCYSWSW